MDVAGGRQVGRDLMFAHWAVDAAPVRRRVPAPLELDTRDGQAWLSVVSFLVRGARPALAPRALGLSFLEVNLS